MMASYLQPFPSAKLSKPSQVSHIHLDLIWLPLFMLWSSLSFLFNPPPVFSSFPFLLSSVNPPPALTIHWSTACQPEVFSPLQFFLFPPLTCPPFSSCYSALFPHLSILAYSFAPSLPASPIPLHSSPPASFSLSRQTTELSHQGRQDNEAPTTLLDHPTPESHHRQANKQKKKVKFPVKALHPRWLCCALTLRPSRLQPRCSFVAMVKREQLPKQTQLMLPHTVGTAVGMTERGFLTESAHWLSALMCICIRRCTLLLNMYESVSVGVWRSVINRREHNRYVCVRQEIRGRLCFAWHAQENASRSNTERDETFQRALGYSSHNIHSGSG